MDQEAQEQLGETTSVEQNEALILTKTEELESTVKKSLVEELVEFNALERLLLMGLLPVKADYYNIKKTRQVRENLSLNEDEIKILNTHTTVLEDNKTNIDWTQINKQIKLKTIDFGEWLTGQITDELKKLHEEEGITESHISLYVLFVEDKEKEE